MIKQLVRANLRNFKAYSSARSLYQTGIFMDANENSLGSVVTTNIDKEINRYPDPYSKELRKALGKFLKLPEQNIFLGNGSDEAIDLLIRLFVEPDEEIMIMEPTYGMYKVSAETAGVAIKNCPLTEDFQIDLPQLLKQISPKTKIIFCCSPNNPTGTLVKPEDIEKLCKNFKGIVVVDEAYIEFASKPSLSNLVSKIDNLVILRTFSKAWGLAGIRVGYALAQKEIIGYLNKIKPPYNLNRLSAKLAERALAQYPKMTKFRKVLLEERKKLAGELTALGFEVFPSEANFLLMRFVGASAAAKTLAESYGIIIRNFGSKPSLKDCVRISVGSPAQNKLLIKSLKEII